MLTLQEYEEIAIKLISKATKYGLPSLALSDELIGRVINYMAVADWKYGNTEGKKLSLVKFRRMRGIYAIRDYIKLHKKNKQNHCFNEDLSNFSFSSNRNINEKAAKKVNFLLKNSCLTERERNVIDLILEDISLSECASRLDITYNMCKHSLASAINKFKRLSKP